MRQEVPAKSNTVHDLAGHFLRNVIIAGHQLLGPGRKHEFLKGVLVEIAQQRIKRLFPALLSGLLEMTFPAK